MFYYYTQNKMLRDVILHEKQPQTAWCQIEREKKGEKNNKKKTAIEVYSVFFQPRYTTLGNKMWHHSFIYLFFSQMI